MDLFRQQAEAWQAAIAKYAQQATEIETLRARVKALEEGLGESLGALDVIWSTIELGLDAGPVISKARKKARALLADTKMEGGDGE